jgi:hypothetical protein
MTGDVYRHHLKHIHNTIRSSKPTIVNPHLTPDVNDLNLYCEVCDYKFSDPNSYSRHLFNVHSIKEACKY